MKYIDQEDPRFTYYIRETLNGFAIQVQNVARDESYPLTPSIAGANGLSLPNGLRMQSCTIEAAVEELNRLAKQNGLLPIE